MKKIILLLLITAILYPCRMLGIYENFDPKEYNDVMSLEKKFSDTSGHQSSYPEGYTLIYTSKSMGLDNGWALWAAPDSCMVLFFKGTTAHPLSIAADFYCAMLPARGRITIDGEDRVYDLSSDPRAGVHGGFLLGFLYLSADIQPKIDSLYRSGYRKFLVAGHSQGGALAYYVAAWLDRLIKDHVYTDMQMKTYASAAPKMGNMYFAYDIESRLGSNKLFTIINSEDIVPEMPVTIQQIEQDMNQPNYLLYLYDKMDGLPFLQRVALKRAFNKMRKSSIKSSEAYQKYLGGYSLKFIQSQLDINVPEKISSTYFVRTGTPISLGTFKEYDEFMKRHTSYSHHSIEAYQYKIRYFYH